MLGIFRTLLFNPTLESQRLSFIHSHTEFWFLPISLEHSPLFTPTVCQDGGSSNLSSPLAHVPHSHHSDSTEPLLSRQSFFLILHSQGLPHLTEKALLLPCNISTSSPQTAIPLLSPSPLLSHQHIWRMLYIKIFALCCCPRRGQQGTDGSCMAAGSLIFPSDKNNL